MVQQQRRLQIPAEGFHKGRVLPGTVASQPVVHMDGHQMKPDVPAQGRQGMQKRLQSD